jgi:exopolyphosphatase/guanosine-5'-triphosphate,3'-diphosphate pyrophosphatase
MATLAAIDIGTNSLKLLVGKIDESGSLEVVSREKESVRLGHETLVTGLLAPEAISAAVTVINRFARIARGQEATEVRAVATCAVREAANASAFCDAVRERCGVEVEVLSGEEEARLINLALRSEFPASCDPLFVVDIGGGSTELVVSKGDDILFTESLELGTVRLSEMFVKSDPIADSEYREMKKLIRDRVKRAAARVRKIGFSTCVGSAGTIHAIATVEEVSLHGPVALSGHRRLASDDVRRWVKRFRSTSLKEKLRIPGLDPRRRDIILAGAMLLSRILRETGATEILTGERGLREGAILDLIARGRSAGEGISRDARAASVDRLLRRSGAEIPHAERVSELALAIFDRTNALHQLTSRERELLQYAAELHDVGRAVGYDGHQRHSYYVIAHAELSGFSRDEIEMIASVARYHEGRKRPGRRELSRLGPWQQHVVEKLAAILRVADGLDRSHRQVIDRIECRIKPRKLILEAAASADCEPELAAARRKSDLFRRVFGKKVDVRARPVGAGHLELFAGP